MVDVNFLSIFKAEMAGHVKQATELVLELESTPPEALAKGDLLEALMREFHTIKGAARAIQFTEITDTAHHIEDVYHALMSGEAEVRLPQLADLSLHAIDRIQGLLEAQLTGDSYSGHEDLPARVAAYLGGEVEAASPPTRPREPKAEATESPEPLVIATGTMAETAEPPVIAEDTFAETTRPEAAADGPPPTPVAESASTATVGPAPPAADTQALPADEPEANAGANGHDHGRAARKHDRSAPNDYDELTDSLLKLTGELSVAVSPLENQRAHIRDVATDLAHLARDVTAAITAVAEQVREDNLVPQLDRLREIRERMQALQNEQARVIESLDFTEGRLQHLTEELGDQVTRARLVPLSTIFSGYPRVVRDLTRELGKHCRVVIEGETMRIDRAVLETLRSPLLHLIRNALDHGIETREAREQSGKDPRGTLEISANQMAGMVRIVVADDGAGIDMDRVRARVLDAGLTTEALWRTMDRHERQQFLFLPGFTTACAVSETSGRGVGLDIVKTDIERVGGHIEVSSESGRGTRFVLELPVNLSLSHCLLVAGGQHAFFGVQYFAFPLHDVGEVRRVTQADLRTVDGREAVRVGNETLLFHDFAALMGLEPLHEKLERKHLLVVGGGNRFGVLVDEVVSEQNTVSHAFDERLGKVRDMQASTLLRDGGVALIVDMKDLLQDLAEGRNAVAPLQAVNDDEAPAEEAAERPNILVVEDSATVREVERHFLEAAGFDVTTAVNGVDGLNKLRSSRFNLVITDIDMPRMNGIELIRKLRAHERYSDIPVIVVSYKDRDQDQAEVLAAGANHFVTKSAFDSGEMLEMIREIVGCHD
ncbi:MAG: response regulator [Alphaproteobacteria bacterium]